ncbi:MAG: SLC13 family permease, partial [Alphaproteobacteria bacterium]|nr:SLC13 family permease [Alphaproteobacteria bacterium]
MTYEQFAISGVLAVALVGFVWGRWRYDVVAFVCLLAGVFLGVVPGQNAFSGFGHPATVTVIAVLILSRALSNSGVVESLSKLLEPATKTAAMHIGALSLIATPLSAIMNNIGALSLLMPVAIQSAVKAKRSPALVLMPLSFASILGGLVTLIGTPPNIIIANYRGTAGGEPFGMFAFTPVGGVIAIVGVAFIALIGWRLIPRARLRLKQEKDLFEIDDYVAEITVGEESAAIGQSIHDLHEAAGDVDVKILGLVREGTRGYLRVRYLSLRAGDRLVVEAPPAALTAYVKKAGFELSGPGNDAAVDLEGENTVLVEAVVPPRSSLTGRTPRLVGLTGRAGLHLLGISRQGRPIRDRLYQVRFRPGDILLLHGDDENVHRIIADLGCLPLAPRKLSEGPGRKASIVVVAFAAAIAVSIAGLVPLPVSFGAAAVAVVVTNVVPLRDLYQTIDWPVVVLLGAMMPIGGALESTGVTALITSGIVELSASLGPTMILAIILIITMTLSDIMNNAATAVVAAPIAYGTALQLGVNPDAFLMAVAVGASCAFLTPIGHQNNTLILGPGGYRFSDYWRVGLPLEI